MSSSSTLRTRYFFESCFGRFTKGAQGNTRDAALATERADTDRRAAACFLAGRCAARWARLDQWVLGWMVLARLAAFAYGGNCSLPRTGDIVVENNCSQLTQVSVDGSLRVAGRGATVLSSRPGRAIGFSPRENTELTLDFVTLSVAGHAF